MRGLCGCRSWPLGLKVSGLYALQLRPNGPGVRGAVPGVPAAAIALFETGCPPPPPLRGTGATERSLAAL